MSEEVERLGDEIWRAVEDDQGKSFISDAIGTLPTRERFFNVVRGHLKYSRRAVRKIENFLKKHGEL